MSEFGNVHVPNIKFLLNKYMKNTCKIKNKKIKINVIL